MQEKEIKKEIRLVVARGGSRGGDGGGGETWTGFPANSFLFIQMPGSGGGRVERSADAQLDEELPRSSGAEPCAPPPGTLAVSAG